MERRRSVPRPRPPHVSGYSGLHARRHDGRVYAKMDAAQVDPEGIYRRVYVQLTGLHLKPGMDTLKLLRHEDRRLVRDHEL